MLDILLRRNFSIILSITALFLLIAGVAYLLALPEPEPKEPEYWGYGAPSLQKRTPAPVQPGPSKPPFSLTASDGTGLALKKLDARARLLGPLAFTELRMTFQNPNNRVIEGRFEIQLPENAAVSRFAMKIGGRWQEGEVVERQKARVTYESYLHQKRDPALLEQAKGNRFRARVFPIPAKGIKELILSYTHELVSSQAPYRLPLKGLSEIAEMNIRVRGGARPVALLQTNVVPHEDILAEQKEENISVSEKSFVLRVRSDLDVGAESLDKTIFMVDTSASQSQAFDANMRRLQNFFASAKLKNPEAEIKLAAFDQSVTYYFRGRLKDLTSHQIRQIKRRRAMGATDLSIAINAKGNAEGHRLILMSDGVATAGTKDIAKLKEQIKKQGFRRVDAITLSTRNESRTLRALTNAATNQGVVEFLDENALDSLLRSTENMQVKGASQVWPKVLYGMGKDSERLIYGHCDGRRESIGAHGPHHGMGASFDCSSAGDFGDFLVNRAVAKAEINAMLDKMDAASGEQKEMLRQKIVQESMRTRITTPFTSMLVLESEREYARFGIERRALADIVTLDHDMRLQIVNRTRKEFKKDRRGKIGKKKRGAARMLRLTRSEAERRSDEKIVRSKMKELFGDTSAAGINAIFGPQEGGAELQSYLGDLTGKGIGETAGAGGLHLRGSGGFGYGAGSGGLGARIGTRNLKMAQALHGAGVARVPIVAIDSNANLYFEGAVIADLSMVQADDPGLKIPELDEKLVDNRQRYEAINASRTVDSQPRADRATTVNVQADLPSSSPILKRILHTLQEAGYSNVRLAFGDGRTSGAADVSTGRPIIYGALDKEIIRRIVRENSAAIKYCYKRELSSIPGLHGKVTMKWVIGNDGRVHQAQTAATTMRNNKVESCLARRIKGWRFPKPKGGGIVVVNYPFVFRTSGESSYVPPPAPTPPKPGYAQMSEANAWNGAYAAIMRSLQPTQTKLKDALNRANAWREESPQNVLAYVALGHVYKAAGKKHEAARAYGSLIDLHPDRADILRFAGGLLESLDDDQALDIAIAAYRAALQERKDHPNSHRYLAYALYKKHDVDAAVDVIEKAQKVKFPSGRFLAIQKIFVQDLKLLAHGNKGRSLRFVLSWETDANDVDLHVYDRKRGHAYFSHPTLPSGGQLYADVRNGFGPEYFEIQNPKKRVGPYRLQAHYYRRGPMGFGMGRLDILRTDKQGRLKMETRPYVVMKDGAYVDLGEVK